MQHTSPAPWHVGGNGSIVYASDGMPVANAVVYHGRTEPGTSARNARLMAAAPELVHHLKALLSLVDGRIPDGNQDFTDARDFLEALEGGVQ